MLVNEEHWELKIENHIFITEPVSKLKENRKEKKRKSWEMLGMACQNYDQVDEPAMSVFDNKSS